MFSSASFFNQPLGKWSVAKVTNMDHMFFAATAFNQPLNKWNAPHIKSSDRMFYGAYSFLLYQGKQKPHFVEIDMKIDFGYALTH